MQKKGIFLKKGVAVAKSFAYIALLGDGHTHRGAAQSGLLFWKILFFQCFSLFDIVNIEKRDAGGVWLCEDFMEVRTAVRAEPRKLGYNRSAI